MPAIARVPDFGSDGNVTITGSPNVFCNGLPVHRLGDFWNSGDVTITGAPHVHINDQLCARIGDAASGPDPHTIVSGSPNSFAGNG